MTKLNSCRKCGKILNGGGRPNKSGLCCACCSDESVKRFHEKHPNYNKIKSREYRERYNSKIK